QRLLPQGRADGLNGLLLEARRKGTGVQLRRQVLGGSFVIREAAAADDSGTAGYGALHRRGRNDALVQHDGQLLSDQTLRDLPERFGPFTRQVELHDPAGVGRVALRSRLKRSRGLADRIAGDLDGAELVLGVPVRTEESHGFLGQLLERTSLG